MYYGGVKQTYPHVDPGDPFFSKSAVIGNLIFLAGAGGSELETFEVSSDDFEDQLTTCLNKIKIALEEADSSLENLVKLWILLDDMNDYSRMWRGLFKYFESYAPQLLESPPAVTTVEVSSLADPDYLVEVDSIAVVSEGIPRWEIKRYPSYLEGEKRTRPNIEPGTPFFSESVSVGNLVFHSCMSGMDSGGETGLSNDFESQMNVALSRLRKATERTGSTLSNLVKTNHFFTPEIDLPILNPKKEKERLGYSPITEQMWRTELGYFEEHASHLLEKPPASTCMQVSSLPDPDSLIGIDAVSVISRDRPGWKVNKNLLYSSRRGFPRHLGDAKMYYADSVQVGNLLFLSGKTGVSPTTGRIESDDLEEQMKTALDKVRSCLEKAGSSLNYLAKTNMLLKDVEDYSTMRKTELEYYQDHASQLVEEPPASTFIEPDSLATSKFLIEIDGIGYIPSKK